LNERKEGVLADIGVFAAEEPGKMRLELYYQVHNSALMFKPFDDVFKAEYSVSIAVLDKKGKKVAGETQEKQVTVATEVKAKSSADFRASQVNLNTAAGKFDIRFTFKDKFSGKSYSKEFQADGRKFETVDPILSDILFAQAAGPADTNSAQFTKGNLMVVPSVSRTYGGEEDSKMLYYIEVYPGSNEQDKLTVQTLIRKRKGDMVYRDTLTSPVAGEVLRQLREISIESFEPGEYELEVELQGRRGKKLDEIKGGFQIKWTEESLLAHNWSLILRQISVIAESGDMKILEEAKSLDERRQALKDYWAAKDPFPETPRNEMKIEFYRRINYANENFGYLNRPGWETDRGRVLVRYGAPDQVDDYPFSLSSYPYQEWHYYKGGRYRKFTFVDDNHDGDYRLVYPFDGLWQTPDF
jgi:GWxTD domain-containing protein